MSIETSDDRKYLGDLLVRNGFPTWFLYFFRIMQNKDFIKEPIHKDMFVAFNEIFNGETTRLNVNVPPRAGKTTFAEMLCGYGVTVNPRSNFIYTSFNQSLLADISRNIAQLLEHPIYKAMYSGGVTDIIDEEVSPIDDFWREYLYKTTGKAMYSSRKIVTAAGGVLLFSSIGSAITGYGAGIRNAKGFAGSLIIDDANKPSDISSQVMRERVKEYFEQTLLSRLNDSKTPIINIQQRLHIDDLSGYLERQYHFKTLTKPLLDENGECQLPTQYTPERIKELQYNDYMFQAQYQQSPIIKGGAVLHDNWWKWYSDPEDVKYKRIFMSCDTASKAKEHNDYTALTVWGVTMQNKLRFLDMVHAKLEIPEVEKSIIVLWEKWLSGINGTGISEILVEDKGSGIELIQRLRRMNKFPIRSVAPNADKFTRVQDAIPYIAAGMVELPANRKDITDPFIAETSSFTADMTHLHDDIVDTMIYAVMDTFGSSSPVFTNWQPSVFKDDFVEFQYGLLLSDTNLSFLVKTAVQDGILYVIDEMAFDNVNLANMATQIISTAGKHKVYCEPDKTEQIKELRSNGVNLIPVRNGKTVDYISGAIKHIQGYEEIIVNSKCKYVLQTLSRYQWKKDPHGNNLPLPDVIQNDAMPAIYYSLDNRIGGEKKVSIF